MKKDELFNKAFKELPSAILADPLRMQTVEDLRLACKIQLDLIEEEQDGTEDDDVCEIRRWLKKFKSSK